MPVTWLSERFHRLPGPLDLNETDPGVGGPASPGSDESVRRLLLGYTMHARSRIVNDFLGAVTTRRLQCYLTAAPNAPNLAESEPRVRSNSPYPSDRSE